MYEALCAMENGWKLIFFKPSEFCSCVARIKSADFEAVPARSVYCLVGMGFREDTSPRRRKDRGLYHVDSGLG